MFSTQNRTDEVLVLRSPFARLGEAARFSETLASSLTRMMQETLLPAEVEALLQISGRERIRWSKDGRLAKSGIGSIRKGKKTIQYSRYPVEEIEFLKHHPEIIEPWRAADAKTNSAG